jgi:uncharacterized membrane protein YcfT
VACDAYRSGARRSRGREQEYRVTAEKPNRLAWVDYSKAICIIAVVGLYAAEEVQSRAGTAGWMQHWVDFCRPFRMPDFFLIAGLFLSRTIDRPWREYLDKKVLHFAYFFTLWTTIYFIAWALHRPSSLDGPIWLLEYLWWFVEPFHMLWFIGMLPVYFVVTRLVSRFPVLLVLIVAAGLQIWSYDTSWRHFDRFGERYVYFYAGYAFASYFFQLADWTKANPRRALLLLACWAVVNGWFTHHLLHERAGISLALGFAGASAVIMVASLLSGFRLTAWLRYLGQNSIVLFLSFYFPVFISAFVLFQKGPIDDAGTLVLIVTAIGVVVPIMTYRLLRGTPARYFFERPGWARLAGHPAKHSTARSRSKPGRIATAELG